MQIANRSKEPTAIRADLGAIFDSLELSRSTWLITSLSPSSGEKMSKHSVRGGGIAGLLERFTQLREKARARTRNSSPILVIQEAWLDGFWIHRVLQRKEIESHVVDPASIATSRRRRRVKTDRLDGEALVRALLAYKRGEPRVCAMVKAPTPEEEAQRRLCRERKVLVTERVKYVNRIKGLLFSQWTSGSELLRRDRKARLEELQTGDGRLLREHLKAQAHRERDRLELLLNHIEAVEFERDALLAVKKTAAPAPSAMLLDIKGIGPEFAATLWSEGLFRHFDNRRQVAAYAGLAPTPWQSGSVDREQGASKSGNPRLRTTLIQLAWLWIRHRPQSAFTLWFEERVKPNGGHLRKTTIAALARKRSSRSGNMWPPASLSKVLRWRPHGKHWLNSAIYQELISPGGSRWAIRKHTRLTRRRLEWSRLPEPSPTQARYWCSRCEQRPNVRLIKLENGPRHAVGLRPWIPQ
jgi:transposase